MRHSIDFHGCNQTRIMHLNTRHTGDDTPSPLRVYRWRIGQSREKGLNKLEQPVCVSWRQAEPISVYGPCSDAPKLNAVL